MFPEQLSVAILLLEISNGAKTRPIKTHTTLAISFVTRFYPAARLALTLLPLGRWSDSDNRHRLWPPQSAALLSTCFKSTPAVRLMVQLSCARIALPPSTRILLLKSLWPSGNAKIGPSVT